MKKFLLIVVITLQGLVSHAQTFTANFAGAAAAIPGTSTTQKFFPITVAGVGNIDDVTRGLAQVCMNITHPETSELEIVLLAPDGTIVPLTIQNGGTGNNYIGTCFTATAAQNIKFGTAPFTGMYTPEGFLGAVNNGQNANGVWNLVIQDRRVAANAGSLTSFSLTFTTTPAPLPPVKPVCSTTLPATSTCANATNVCDFSGLCGTTAGNTVNSWGTLNAAACFNFENNSFIKFVASAATASFSVWVPTNTIGGNYNLGGLQLLFFSGTCGSGPVTTYGCYPHIYPYSAPGKPLVSVVTASGLTPGNTYYLVIDGFNGDNTTFTIEALTGVNVLNITPAVASVCPGASVVLTATGGNGIYSWTPSATLSSSTGATVTASPTMLTTYTVTSATVAGCPLTKDVTVSITPPPAITTQPSTATQNICPGQNATALTITATAGSGSIGGYQWYVNTVNSNTGGTLIPGATIASYTPPNTPSGTFYYYCVVTNSNTCTTNSNVSGPVNVLPALAAPATSATLQPTCIANGTITVTAPLGANFNYSINGATYQASPVFPGLAPNSYNVTVKNIVTGCESVATVVVISNPPTLAAPAASATLQPTCSAGGTITVTSPLGANYTYSINGTTYQASPVFPGLAPNSYNVTVKDNVSGCTSAATVVVINNPPTIAAPAASVTLQPNCSATGTIAVSSPLGANYTYSIDGTTYQASPVFTGITATGYNVTVKDITTGCISAITVVTVTGTSVLPAPTASATLQPTCLAGGTITVSSPLGAGYSYSINGTTYQASPVFSGLAPNSYNVTVKDNASGCVSAATVIVINNPPTLPPPAAMVSLQPTCTVPFGVITVTSPLGANYQYSINGVNYQVNPSFPTLSPNTYNVTVKDITTGCISAATVIVINSPAVIAPPVASAALQPTCVAGGTITVSSPLGANYTYSIDGTNYQGSPIFTPVAMGTYNVTVKDLTTGCISGATSVILTNPSAVPAPVALITQQPGCSGGGGSITVTSPLGPVYMYSADGISYQSSPVLTPLSAGTYNVTVKNSSTGCVSVATPLTLVSPSALAAPAAVVSVQPTCSTVYGTIEVTSPLGTQFEYSINGIIYQAGVSFGGLLPNTYNVTVRDITTGCVSSATVLTINNPPGGPAAPTVSVTQQPTCTAGGTITVTAPLAANFQYSLDGTTYQTSPVFSTVAAGNYNITVQNISSGCISTATPVVLTNPAAPPAPTASATRQPTCIVNGDITVTAPLGANYTYSIDGTNYQASPIFTSLNPGTYNVTVKNLTTNCVSAFTPVVIDPRPNSLPSLVYSAVQPTCPLNSGVVTVTAPIGPDIVYSLDGGLSYQVSPVIFAPGGSWLLVAKNMVTGCESNSVFISFTNAVPLAAPLANTQQPTCAAAGSIAVTSPLGAQYQYSIDGVNYQPGVTFGPLVPATYNLTVKNMISLCMSAVTTIILNPPPGGPAAPTASVTQQPTCSIITGSITITAPTGAGLEYSIDGITYQAGLIFNSVAPGTYNVTVRNAATGCVSASTPVTVNTLPAIPTAPIASVTQQPTCANNTGTITISGPTGPNLQYSINGTTYQASPVFTGVAPGPYNLTVQNTISTCISSVSMITVNPPPNAPAAPTASVTKPATCIAAATITITAPLGTDLQYSINGTTYQSSPVFANAPPGPYNITVQNSTTLCISAPFAVTVAQVLPAPAAPTASATKQPTCADNTGTITITAPLGTDLEYTIDGITYQPDITFTGLTPATYNIRVRNINTSCLSPATTVVITAVPNAPAAPTVVTAPRCGPGSVSMTATGTGTLNWYSNAALTNLVATGATYAPSVNSTTTFYVTATNNNCTSPAKEVMAEVNPLPMVTLGSDRSVCKGESLVLSPGIFSSYIWQDNSTQPTFKVTTSGTYSVKVKNAAGCENTASVKIDVTDNCDDIRFPTAFTPNGDGKNDEFGPLPPNSFIYVTEYNLILYNRYGQRVFQSNTPVKKWNGKFLGMLTPGNYVWFATYKFKGKAKEKKGNILVIK